MYLFMQIQQTHSHDRILGWTDLGDYQKNGNNCSVQHNKNQFVKQSVFPCLCFSLSSFSLICIVPFKKESIQKEGHSRQERLLFRRSPSGKVDFKGVTVGEDFRHHRLWDFDNLAQHGLLAGITVRTLGIRGKDPKGHLATALAATGITFGAAIDTAATATRGGMHQVNLNGIIVLDLERRDAVVTRFLDGSERHPARTNRGRLIATAFAT